MAFAAEDSRSKPGVLHHDLSAEAARKVIYFHFRKMLRHEVGTILGDDIEELHDMRVATRRMRSALDVFWPYFPQDQRRSLKKGLRKTGKALGRVRDLDVFLEKFHHDQEQHDPTTRQNLDPMGSAWSQKRKLAQGKMLAFLERPKFLRFKLDFWTFLETPITIPFSDTAGQPVSQVAPQLIASSIQNVYDHFAQLTIPTVVELHALRIAFKRHRYTLEFFREILGPQVENCIQLMNHLGDLNDAKFALDQIEPYRHGLLVERTVSPNYLAALAHYTAVKQNEIEHLIATFPARWDQFAASDYEHNLHAAQATLVD